MLALSLPHTGDFMNKLLKSEIFDHFLLQEAKVVSGATFVIDGSVTKGFYTEEEQETLGIRGCRFLPYALLRPHLLALMRGKRTPASFQVVLALSPENLRRTLESTDCAGAAEVSGMCFIVRFQNQTLTATTGISYQSFSADRTLDAQWDRLMRQFLTRHGISFEEM